ncbi:GNAT family N-acetyltransferase [Curtobacterium sp. MCPF17_047]|uniref:GNAT family N-acetyltransferase n=1 Tax=unclassified Curtobacterium TaxID=257496 RepID=UPI000DAA470D|nr:MULTISPECIES: GNAT family N-acetyltransferase [unclassified Curtobacterium]PZE62971.1 GNAT family N-acetyltransferase [Curtobacterium sp. MCPF17_001]PZF68901.1 GNAT family N-acetyltransferase [Curtobacterium sp. MCPF17_047]
MTLEIRAAAPADALQIARVHKRSREAYYGDALDPVDAARDRYPMWLDTLTRADTWCAVAVLHEDLVGFIAGHLPERDDLPAELSSLYVDPDRFGSGVGSALYQRFVDVVSSGTAELEVWDGNDRAKRFYEHRGWQPTEQIRAGVTGKPFVTWTLDLRPCEPDVRSRSSTGCRQRAYRKKLHERRGASSPPAKN